MKKHTLLFLLVLVLLMVTLMHAAEAQKSYVLKIKLKNGQVAKGELLYAGGDSLGLFQKNIGGKQFKLFEILAISIRRKGSVGRGAAIGAGTGAVVGALVGVASYEPPHCPPGPWFCVDFGPGIEAAGGAMLGIVVGSLVGGMVGSGSKEIKINSDQKQFDSFMLQYSLVTPDLAIKK